MAWLHSFLSTTRAWLKDYWCVIHQLSSVIVSVYVNSHLLCKNRTAWWSGGLIVEHQKCTVNVTTYSSLSCNRWTHKTCCIVPIILCTRADAQCDKQAMVAGQLLTTLVMVHNLWQCFSKSRVLDNVPEGNVLIFGDTLPLVQHNRG